MSGRGIPFGLLLATAGAMAWLLSHPVTVRAAAAPQYRVQCPKSLPADTTPTRARDDGWTASAPAGFIVDGAGMLHGAPDEQGYLKPDTTGTVKRGKGEVSVTRWSFDMPHWYETWLYCTYGPIELARRIPVNATACTVTIKVDGKQRTPPVFECWSAKPISQHGAAHDKHR